MQTFTPCSLPILGLLLLSLISCSEKETEALGFEMPNDTIYVSTLPLTKQEWQKPIQASGRFTTDEIAVLAFKTGGITKELSFEEGDYIREGEIMAKLDMTEINAQVNKAVIGHEKALRDLERTENLYRDSVATREQWQNAQTAFNLAKEELEAARFNQDHSVIYAPYNGFVVQKMITSGQIVSGGTPVYTINGLNTASWSLKVHVSDRDWVNIQYGDSARIQAGALPGRSYRSTVIKKSKTSDPVTGTFWIELSIPSFLRKKLAHGMYGSATIFPREKTPGWTVPHNAVLDANGGKGYIFVTGDQTTTKQLQIEILDINNAGIHISGPAEALENSELIVDGNAYLKEGSTIHIVRSYSETRK